LSFSSFHSPEHIVSWEVFNDYRVAYTTLTAKTLGNIPPTAPPTMRYRHRSIGHQRGLSPATLWMQAEAAAVMLRI
jgi:hypothetical protein